MLRLEDITQAVLSYNPDTNIDIILKAYVYSAKVHRGQTRLSGEPYLSHPLYVSYILTKLKMDVVTVAVGLLHDTIEDTYSTSEEIEKIFGEEVLSLVDGVTKISKIQFKSSEEKQAENFRKMIIAMANDIRVILIKLADRVHNMRTLQYIAKKKQMEIARETMDIYAPIANRLGIGWLKAELEDNAFKYLNSEEYTHIEAKITKNYEERAGYIEQIRMEIAKELKKARIKAEITGRPKHFYSIYHKMGVYNLHFDQLYDLLGLRIITNNIKNCYAALGIIHSRWKPVHGKVKDYIAMPKANMYQSLHTSVIGNDGRRIEFQIRTDEMHKVAEEGIAAHWRYKEGRKKLEKDDKWFIWLRHLLEWQQDLKNPREFLDTVKTDLFPDEVYVFTPKGEVKSFPAGATVVDFAYNIHTQIGNTCAGARVNGSMAPLKYQLKSGDIVEIITYSHHVPNKDWLKIVKTSKAKNKIRNWIKEEQKDRSITLGKEILDKEIEKYKVDLSAVKIKNMQHVAEELGFSHLDNMLANIGYGKLSIQQVICKIVPEEIRKKKKKAEESRLRKIVNIVSRKPAVDKGRGIRVKGLDDLMIRFGRCCSPIPGDEIIGFITRGRGVSIHVRDCSSIAELAIYDTDRLVNVEWDSQNNIVHTVRISIVTEDKPGLLAKISAAITSCDVNISGANIHTTKDKKGYFDISVDITNLDHLNKIMSAVKKVKGIISVHRIRDDKTGRRIAN